MQLLSPFYRGRNQGREKLTCLRSHNYALARLHLTYCLQVIFDSQGYFFLKERNYYIIAGKKIQICTLRNTTENHLRFHDQEISFLYIYTMYNTHFNQTAFSKGKTKT